MKEQLSLKQKLCTEVRIGMKKKITLHLISTPDVQIEQKLQRTPTIPP